MLSFPVPWPDAVTQWSKLTMILISRPVRKSGFLNGCAVTKDTNEKRCWSDMRGMAEILFTIQSPQKETTDTRRPANKTELKSQLSWVITKPQKKLTKQIYCILALFVVGYYTEHCFYWQETVGKTRLKWPPPWKRQNSPTLVTADVHHFHQFAPFQCKSTRICVL